MEPNSVSQSRKGALMAARRGAALLLCFALLFLFLAARIFCLQVFGYEDYQARVMDEITVASALRAERGSIYDRNGNVLATTKTVYRIYISPKNIQRSAKRSGLPLAERIADGLSELLGIRRETILQKTEKVGYLDETVARSVDAECAARVR